jgi:tRNA modification GTPase
MSLLPDSNDTICAVATPPGASGIAVVRVSGPRAVEISHRLVPALGQGAPARRLRLCRVIRPADGEVLDRALVAVMPGPRSYTTQDVVELQLHGGTAVVAAVLTALVSAGARPARPGEFTLRAFLNGRIDLGEAEAVAALVEARSERAHRVALRQLDGGLRAAVEPLRRQGITLLAELEARLDFPDQELEALDGESVARGLTTLRRQLERLIAQGRAGRRLREGARVVLMGRPNVGKSSLLNALSGTERAIVHEAPGTTRDWIEQEITLEGMPVTVVDTAGQREACAEAEHLGVSRGREQAAGADLVLLVLNLAEGITDDDRRLLARLADASHGVVLNQSDRVDRDRRDQLRQALPAAVVMGVTAAPRGWGIRALRRSLAERLGLGEQEVELPAITESRHEASLERARRAIVRAEALFTERNGEELIALELREAIQALGELMGAGVSEDVLETIFSRFCIGK